MTDSSKKRNRLAAETSPYLLQHAENPVDWYPWGPEALDQAKRLDRPILLSVGYAACHWCHVMEHESFSNLAIAAVMNENYVCIKVDREERPDIDDIFMAATVAINGGGGWPMTVFLTPEQRPFYAGTYFPPDDRYGRPGFGSLLERIASLWQSDRQQLAAEADKLCAHVQAGYRPSLPGGIDGQLIERAVRQAEESFDAEFGGFGPAPKFPPCALLSLLLLAHKTTGNAHTLKMVTTTLDAMKNGGMYDHLAGGFARYSTDERWLVPHFEKMLYDNAQLASVYTEAYQATHDEDYRRVAEETLGYVVREMQGPEGGYFSATDADSEGVEGKYFVWSKSEVEALLGDERAAAFCAYYDVTVAGNFEGQNILNTPRSLEQVAEALALPAEALRARLTEDRQVLYQARQRRVPPLLDDKVLTAWNGLMLGAMASGYRAFLNDAYLDSASRAADYLLAELRRADGSLMRTARAQKAHIDAYLEDYAYLGDGLLSLYEVSGQPRFLDGARELAERMILDFGSDEGSFFFTAEHHEALFARPREGHDGALPNPGAIAARLLARLSIHLDRPEFRQRAERALTAYAQGMQRLPRAFASALGTVDWLLEGPTELVLVGDPSLDATRELQSELARHYLPHRVEARVDPNARPSHPATTLTMGKTAKPQEALLYLCEHFVCDAPIAGAAALRTALTAHAEKKSAKRRDGIDASARIGPMTR